MSAPIVIVVDHLTRPGCRDEVQAAWHRLMAPAVASNPGHLAYVYCEDPSSPDAITAVQVYRDDEAATAFLNHEAYRTYERIVAPLLQQPPRVRRLESVWTKPALQGQGAPH